MFGSVSEHFTNLRHKNSYKSCISTLSYRTSGKSFATNASNLTYSIQNDVWECFGTFHKTSTQKLVQKLYLEAESTILGYRTSGKCFATNTSNLSYWTQNDVLDCYGAFHKPSARKIMQNLCFRAEGIISVYQASKKSFAMSASNQIQ